MGINVDYFFQFVQYCINKDQSGNSTTPEQFNIVANQAQLFQFTADYETYVKTGVVSNYLKTFLTIGSVFQVNPNNNIVPYPANLQYISSIRYLYNGTQYKAEWVDNIDIGDVLRPNSLIASTPEFVKWQYVDDGIQFFVTNAMSVYLDYFATPTPPFWNYTISQNEPVYNPTGSVNFEFDSYFLNRIASIYLQMVGVNLSDANIAGFAQQFTAETKVDI